MPNRAIFAWPWNENAQTKQKKQTNGNRANWLVYRAHTNARGSWLIKRTLGWKKLMPEELSRTQSILRFDIILQHDWPIEQCLLHIRIFWQENEESMFWSFHPLADKTNNEHLPKPFFKVIRKLLYSIYKTCCFSSSVADPWWRDRRCPDPNISIR